MSDLQGLLELYSRRFSYLNIPDNIKGYEYAKAVVEETVKANASNAEVKKGEALKDLKVDLVCSSCGKEGAVRMKRQLRSGDEGENVVIMCPNCGTTITVG